MSPIIRFAKEEDADALLAVYAPYVLSSDATTEITLPRAYDLRRRIATISATLPFLVCEINGEIAGFAYAVRGAKQLCYAWNANVSVYIGKTYQRRNIASALYLAVISLLSAMRYRNVYAYVPSGDVTSEQFHSAFGFSKVGFLENTGYKNGKWFSVSVFGKALISTDEAPEHVKRITDIDEAFCQKNFEQCAKIIRKT